MTIEDRIRKVKVEFKQISAGTVGLYGLDADGGVWRYYPAVYESGKVKKYSGWYRLTTRGLDATGPRDPEGGEGAIDDYERERRLK